MAVQIGAPGGPGPSPRASCGPVRASSRGRGRSRGLGAKAGFSEAVDAWLQHLAATKQATATISAYRRDVQGIVGRISADDFGGLRLPDLTKGVLRAAFASWASDHAATSVMRAHSAWSSFFDFLVAHDVVEGNPMAGVAKPKPAKGEPRAIQHLDAAARLLATAAVADPRCQRPWAERDLALIATFCVTGIRVGEAVRLNVGSVTGPAGARHLVIVGRGGRRRSIPVHDALVTAIENYMQTRAVRFPGHRLDDATTPLFVDTRGRRLSADQIKYLTERLYVRAELRAQVPPGALVDAMRHTFALSALRAGADILQLQVLLGHASLETTRRYLETTGGGLREMTRDHPGQVALRSWLETTSDRASVRAIP